MNGSKELKIASIINGIIGCLTFSLSSYSAVLLITGFILYILSTEKDIQLKNYKTLILIIGFLLLPFNLISSIFVFVGAGNLDSNQNVNGINAPPKIVKKVLDPEMKKIDSLLKLGVGMVFISGILFATTSWDFISNPLKALFLFLLGIIFLGLSILTERKLKLYKSSYMYWLLSMAFFLLTVVATLYFNLFGELLAYNGSGKNLAYFITFFTATGLSFATYLKHPKNYLLLTSYTCLLLVVYHLLAHLISDNAIVLIIISFILFIVTYLTNKEQSLYNYNKLLVYLMIPFILICKSTNSILILILTLLNIVNQYLIQMKYQEEDELYVSTISIYILIPFAVFKLNAFEDFNYLLTFILMTIHTLLIKFNYLKEKESNNLFNYSLYSIAAIILYLFLSYKSATLAFILTILYLVINYFESTELLNTEKLETALYLEPLAILLTIASTFNLGFIQDVSFTTIITITTILYCVMHYIRKEPKSKTIYTVATIIGIFASIENNLLEKATIPALIMLLPSAYILYNAMSAYKVDPNKNALLIFSYLITLFSIYNILNFVNVLDVNTLISSIIFIWILILFIILSHIDVIKKITYFALIVPLLNIIGYLNFNYVYKQIMISVISLYVLFLLIKFFITKPEDKNTVGIIGIIIAILEVLSISDPIIGIYIGLIGIVVILIGYYKEEFKSFFKTGITITILNIIFQLRDLWEQIPFWLYLLLGGLGIIGFVTYKELKKSQNK